MFKLKLSISLVAALLLASALLPGPQFARAAYVPLTQHVAQQPAPTAAPSATQQSGRRERIEAPPLRPQAAALLIGANLLLAVAVVMLAWVLRRRQQRR